jgi:hypothetical protein
VLTPPSARDADDMRTSIYFEVSFEALREHLARHTDIRWSSNRCGCGFLARR